MTKPRAPFTFQRALARIADTLGWDGCADVLGKSESFVRKLGDPDAAREISLQDALRLDNAYHRAGGDGAPFFECYAHRLEAQDMADALCPDAMVATAGRAAKEAGEAVSAVLTFANNPGCERARRAAATETEEAISVLTRLARKLVGGGANR